MTMELAAVGPAARDVWNEVLPTDPNATVSQTPTWMDCVCACGRYADGTRAYRNGDGRHVILPLARRRDLPAAAGVAGSMPYGWGNGGVVCSDGRVSAEELADVVADLLAQPALSISVKPSPGADSVWAAAVPGDVVRMRHMSQTVDLSGGFDSVWKRCEHSVRRWCRKAERIGLTVEWDDTGRLVGVFDELYRKSVVRWARQQNEPLHLAQWRARRRNPKHKFELVADRLGPACRMGVAWRDGQPAAALAILAHGEHVTAWRGAMDKEVVAGSGANELLHCMAIEEACSSGRRFFHLGESAPRSSLARNKRAFGAEEYYSHSYNFEHLPLTAVDRFLRRQVKRVIGFRD